MTEGRLCILYSAVGRVEGCPGADCPLWIVEAGRSGCALAGVEAELAGSADLTRYLVELRLALEEARTSEERMNAHSLFSRRLNEEQAAGA